jgi:hypothetical protein
MIHSDTITIVDRVALSNALFEIAESFVQEATLWPLMPSARDEFNRTARKLAEIARGVLGGYADFAKAEAFHDAGLIQLGRAMAARRFVTAFETPPQEVAS